MAVGPESVQRPGVVSARVVAALENYIDRRLREHHWDRPSLTIRYGDLDIRLKGCGQINAASARDLERRYREAGWTTITVGPQSITFHAPATPTAGTPR